MSDARERMSSLNLIGGAIPLDFANTGRAIRDYGDLVAWVRHVGALGDEVSDILRQRAGREAKAAQRAYEGACTLREAVHRIFTRLAMDERPHEDDLALLSRLVNDSAKHRRLRRDDDVYIWDWESTNVQLALPTWAIARSAADLLTSSHRTRIRQCASEDCDWLFVDTSRNHSRRWCDMADCGNRAKARRNYARRRLARGSQDG